MAGVADKNAFKAGLFILAAVALAMTVLYLVSGKTVSGGQERVVVFELEDDIAGLSVGSELRVGGKNVGEVRGIDFDDNYQRVLVKIVMPDDVPLREGAVVRVQSTLTGISWLNLSNLGNGEPLPEDEPIQGSAGTISDLVRTVTEIAPEVRDVVATVRGQTVPAANRALTNVGDAAQTITDLAGDEQVQGDVKTSLANLREASDRLPKLMEDAGTLVNAATETVGSIRSTVEETGETLAGVLEKADAAAVDVQGAASSARGAVTEVSSLIRRNRPQVALIIDRLADTSRTLDLAASELRRSPWRLLYRPDGGQRESLDLYDTARRFAEGANALQDAAVALQGASEDPEAKAEEIDALLETVQERFDTYREAEQALYRRLRD